MKCSINLQFGTIVNPLPDFNLTGTVQQVFSVHSVRKSQVSHREIAVRFELRRLTDYCDEAILNEIRRVAESVPQPTLSRKEFRKRSRVSPTTIDRRFGGWEKALQAAGLARRFDSSNKAIPREEVLAELGRVSKLLGAHAVSREQFNAHARFTDACVRKAFGSWHKAMKAAGLITNALGKRYTDDDCFENLLFV
jgi:hypothetical protein